MQSLKRPPALIPKPPSFSASQNRHRSTTTLVTRHRTQNDLIERAHILRTRVRAARHARREDHLLGPLAPNRLALDDEYGCVSTREMRGVKNSNSTGMCRSPWMEGAKQGDKGWRDSLIEVGDQVAVVAGRERGKVGRVTEVRKNEGEVIVEDLNLADIKVPSYILVADPTSPQIRTISLPIPLTSVRLIHPLTTYSEDGTPKVINTIVEKLIRRPGHGRRRFIQHSDRATGSWIEVPLQKKYQPEVEEPKDQDIDTLRFEVEESTWTPTLLRAPMPGGVIDELRNKYSKFRTRHDPGYQRAIDNRAARKKEWEEWKRSAGGLLDSPAKEARRREVEGLRAKGKPELKEEVLERIGEVMAAKGVVMTEGRRRGLERNLSGIVHGGAGGVEGMGYKEDAEAGDLERMEIEDEEGTETAAEAENEGENVEEVDAFAEGELQTQMEKMGIDEIVVEQDADQKESEGRERRR